MRKFILYSAGAIAVLATGVQSAHAQVQPPRPLAVYVNPAQPLSFGAFYQSGGGGSIVMSSSGFRSATGDVVLANLGYSVSPALFEVEGLPGTIVTLMNGPDVTLRGSNGGSMVLHLGDSNPTAPFLLTSNSPSRTVVTVGGTLTVGSAGANPPGIYNGSFSITFIEQ